MADQCALGADGTLLDASQNQWFNDADNDTPLLPTANARRSTRIPRPAPNLVDPKTHCSSLTSRPKIELMYVYFSAIVMHHATKLTWIARH